MSPMPLSTRVGVIVVGPPQPPWTRHTAHGSSRRISSGTYFLSLAFSLELANTILIQVTYLLALYFPQMAVDFSS